MRKVNPAPKHDSRKGKSQMNLNWVEQWIPGALPQKLYCKYLTCLHGLGWQFDHFTPTAVWTTEDRGKLSSVFVIYISSRVSFSSGHLYIMVFHGLLSKCKCRYSSPISLSASSPLPDSEENQEPLPFRSLMSVTFSLRILRGIINSLFNKDNG